MCHPDVPDGRDTPLVERAEVSIELPSGERMPALVARAGSEATPAVLVVSDIFGRSAFYEDLAARLAAAGHHALVPDYFFRQGPLAEHTREAAFARRGRLDENQTLADLTAALGWLSDQPSTADGRVGTVGFCMGGTMVLDLAAIHDHLATVCFYGFPVGSPHGPTATSPPVPLDVVGDMQGPIVGFWGDGDEGVSMADVEKFAAAARDAGVDFTHTIYPGVGHGFLARGDIDDTDSAAGAAWGRTIEFFSQHLG